MKEPFKRNYVDHPIASIFPILPESDLEDLAADISANGLLNPIVLFEGKILDGRNRYRACKLARVTPRAVELADIFGGSPLSFVISENEKRRHLTPSQRAACAVLALPWFEKEAKDRQKAALKRGDKIPVRPKMDGRAGRSDEAAGRQLKVSRSQVAEAKAILKASPALFDEIALGTKTVSEVKRKLKADDYNQPTVNGGL